MVGRSSLIIFTTCFALSLFSMDDSIVISEGKPQNFMDLVRMCNDMFSVSFARPTLSESDIFLIEGKKSQFKEGEVPEWAKKPEDFARKLVCCFERNRRLLEPEKEEKKRKLAQRLAKLNYNLQQSKKIKDNSDLFSSFCIIEEEREEDNLLANHVARFSKELKIGERVKLALLWIEHSIANIQEPQKK